MALNPISQHMRMWDEDEKRLMSFYGFDLTHPERGQPIFGPDIRVQELRDGRRMIFQETLGEEVGVLILGRDNATLTTMLNLACYFHHPKGYLEVLHTISRSDQGAATDLTAMVLQDTEDRFFHQHVQPLRTYLQREWQFYFYCVPMISYATSPQTGQWVKPGGPLILTLLPQFPDVARKRGVDDPKMKQLALTVFWVVRSHLCPHKLTVEQRHELIEVITAWSHYVPPYTLLLELDQIERNNPLLVTSEVRHAVIPKSALALLRSPSEHETLGTGETQEEEDFLDTQAQEGGMT